MWSSGFQRQDHFHVKVQRHWMEHKRKWRIMRKYFEKCCKIARLFPRGHWSILVPGSKKMYGTYDDIPSGYWTQIAEKMPLNFEKSGHPLFRCTSALEKDKLRSKEGGKTTFHFTACEENVQLLLKMVMSVNQLSLYGATAVMIQGLPADQVAPGRLAASDQTEQEILIQPLIAEVPSNDERQGNLLQDYERRFEKRP